MEEDIGNNWRQYSVLRVSTIYLTINNLFFVFVVKEKNYYKMMNLVFMFVLDSIAVLVAGPLHPKHIITCQQNR